MTPILIDGVNLPVFLNTPQMWWGPFESGGGTYLLARVGNNVTVYKSVDNGATWAIQDAANRPVMAAGQGAAVYYSGAGTVLDIAFSSALGIQLTTFDMATDTFGVVTAALAQNANALWLTQLSNGAFRVYLLDAGFAAHKTRWAEYSGGVWGAATIVSTNIADSRLPQFLLQSNDILGLFWQDAAGVQNVYYRQLSAAGVLGALQTIIAAAPAAVTLGRPLIWNGKIGLPYIRRIGFNTIPAIMWGNPEAVPVWTSEDTAPAETDGNNSFLALDGPNLRYWYLVEDNANIHRVYYTVNSGVAWGVPVLFYDEVTDPVIPAPPVQVIHNLTFSELSYGWSGMIGLERGTAQGGQVCTVFFLVAEAPPAPQASRVVTGTRRMVVLVPDPYDHCLWKEIPLHRQIPALGKCCLSNARESYFHNVEMPEGSVPFHRTAGIPTPLAAAGDVLILALEVPSGFDGVLRGIFHHYTGPGFLEGSGDIQWRIKINRTYAWHLGRMLVSMGQIGEPYPLEDGIPVTSLQRLEYLVSAPNLSGGILPVNSQIVAGIEGWMWPRR